MIDKQKQGKKSRIAGNNFEKKVREELEKKGWIVVKWANNVDLKENKLITAKTKWNNFTKRMMMGKGGFPDFIAFRQIDYFNEFAELNSKIYLKSFSGSDSESKFNGENYLFLKNLKAVIGIESKINGKLDKEEKEKCEWLLRNNILNKIFIASKKKIGRKVEVQYTVFLEKKNG